MKFLQSAICLLIALLPSLASATQVKISKLKDDTKLVNKATGEEISLADKKSSAITLELTPGTYIISGTNTSIVEAPVCTTEFEVKEPSAYGEKGMLSLSITYLVFTPTNSKTVDGKSVAWALDEDFTFSNFSVTNQEGEKIDATPSVWVLKGVKMGICVLGFRDDTVNVDFIPTDLHPEYAPYSFEEKFPSSNTRKKFTFAELMTFTLSFPSNASGSLSYKKGSTNYVPFLPMTPDSESTADGITTYSYKMGKNSQVYCYRVSREDAITCAGLVSPNKTPSVTITEEQLSAHTKSYCAHEVGINFPNSGTHYADIFLNINKRNLLRMEQGKKFQIVNLRTWQLTNSSTDNYFVEPDYSWTVLNTDFQPDNSVVEVDDKGVLTAKKPGTAIVQVRYDAISLGAMNGDLWDALWAENTGTFVVTVGADESKAPADNIRLSYKPDFELDAEHDILYYLKDEAGYKLTFTPAEGSSVAVANPIVDRATNTVAYPQGFSQSNVTTNADGSVTALLTYGRNIIRTTDAEGNSNYQVLSAKPATLDLITSRDDNYLLPGDNITLQFDGLFHVAGKLASIYNSNCHIRYGDVTANDGVILGVGQYDFAGSAEAQQFPIAVSATQTADMLIDGGCLNPQGYGSAPGAHRGINYEVGMDPNFNAGISSGAFGSLPAKTLKITQLKDVDRLKVTIPLGSRACPVNPAAMAAAFGEDAHWVSSDPAIARVGENGEIFPVSAGSVVLTAINDKQRDNTPLMYCDVTVPANENFVAVTGISITNTNTDKDLNGTTLPLKMNFSWGNWGNYNNQFYAKVTPSDATNTGIRVTSENPDIVAVGKKGLASWESSGKSVRVPLFWNDATRMPGESLITVETLDGGYKAHVVVKWMRGADDITLEPAELTLAVGDTYQLDATVKPDYTSYPVKWSSSDASIVTVDENGLVSAVAKGSAQVKASVEGTSYDENATTNITVVDKTVGIENAETEVFRFGPNPCQGVLNILSSSEADIQIFSLEGALTYSTHIGEGASTIDLSHLGCGIYLLRAGEKSYKLIRK